MNVKRRHSNSGPLAFVALEAKKQFAREAKERMRAGGGDKKSGTAERPHPVKNKGRARDRAAKAVGTSGRKVQRAKAVKKASPETFEKEQDWDTYSSLRKKFIRECLSKRMTYEEIGQLLNLTKQRIYQLVRYGETGHLTIGRRNEIKERDNHRCKICRKKHRRLHIHHIGDPKNRSQDNLITLCPTCHKKVDMLKKSKEKALSTASALDKSK